MAEVWSEGRGHYGSRLAFDGKGYLHITLGDRQVVRLTMEGRRVMNVEQIYQRKGRVRDVRQGPDGYVYLAIEDSRGAPTPIVRLEPLDRK